MTLEQICERLDRIEDEFGRNVDVDFTDCETPTEMEGRAQDAMDDAEEKALEGVAALKLDIEIAIRRRDESAQTAGVKDAA